MPRVSVLIPTYRRPTLLKRALQSVIQQGEEVEIIVGDNGGANEEVIAGFGPEIRHLRNPPATGLPGNVHRLANEATGELYAFLMDDDYWLPGFLSKSITAFTRFPDLGIAFTNHFFENGARTLRECSLPPGRHDDFAIKLLSFNPVPLSASMIRRTVWDSVAPLPNTSAFDFVIWARAAEQGASFYYIDEPLMVYKSNPSGLSASRVFRDDVVTALEAIRFSDPEAQGLLERRLSAALYARAKGRLATGRIAGAIMDGGRLIARGTARIGSIGRWAARATT